MSSSHEEETQALSEAIVTATTSLTLARIAVKLRRPIGEIEQALEDTAKHLGAVARLAETGASR